MRIAALLLVVALAGCLGGSDGSGGDGPGDGGSDDPGSDPPDGGAPPDPPSDPGPTGPVPLAMLLAFDYTDCSGVETRFHPSMDAAADVLPAGYEAAAVEGPLGDRADVQYLILRCDGFSTASSGFNDTMFGHVAVRIEAPEGATDAEEHWYRLLMFTEPGLMTNVWQQAGYPVYTAQMNRSAQGVATVTFGDYEATGLAATETMVPTVTRSFYTVTDAGVLEWTGSFEAAGEVLHGTFSVADEDPFASAWGDGVGQAEHALYGTAQMKGNDLWLIRSA